MNASKHRIVLLVEDSDDDAFFFERAFRRAALPAEFVRLKDGREAVAFLERARAEQSDEFRNVLMFLDLKMPGMNGFEVLQWMREHRLECDVIVLSGSELELDVTAARELGAREYLVKPISPEKIQEHFALHESLVSRP